MDIRWQEINFLTWNLQLPTTTATTTTNTTKIALKNLAINKRKVQQREQTNKPTNMQNSHNFC